MRCKPHLLPGTSGCRLRKYNRRLAVYTGVIWIADIPNPVANLPSYRHTPIKSIPIHYTIYGPSR